MSQLKQFLERAPRKSRDRAFGVISETGGALNYAEVQSLPSGLFSSARSTIDMGAIHN
jgi:hypothetical protein